MILSRPKKLFLFVSAFAILGTFPYTTSMAEETDVYFYPAKGWKIGSVENTGEKICSVGATFNNGFILNFQGSDKWVETLNIDLRQDALKKGENYPARISVPGVMEKDLSAQATSLREVSIKMTGNKELYQNMRNSSVFDLDIEGNQFRFYMVGFADEAEKFERCMAGAEVSMQVADVSGAVRELEVSTKNTTNETMQMEKTEAMALEGAPVESMGEASVSDVVLPLPEDVEPAPVVPVVNLEDKAPEKPITKNYKTDVKFTKSTKKVEADLTEVPQKAQHKPKKVVHAAIDHDSNDSAEVRKLKQMVKDLQEENRALNKEVTTISTEARVEDETIETRNWNLERATMRYHEAERQLKKLGQQLQQERAKCTLEKGELEGMLFDPQVTEAQQAAHLADLQRQLEDMQARLDNQRRTYEERIKALEAQ